MLLAATKNAQKHSTRKKQPSEGGFGNGHKTDLTGIVLGSIRSVTIAPGAGIDAVRWQGSVGAAGVVVTDGTASGEDEIVRNDEVGDWSACGLQARGAEQHGMVKSVARQIGRERKAMGYGSASITQVECLAADELLTAEAGIEQLDELQGAAAIGINLANSP